MLQKYCWCPKIGNIAAEICRSCPLCQCLKSYTTKPTPPMHKTIVKTPYDLVCMDILSLPSTKRGNSYLFVVACHASKFIQCFPLKNHTSETIIKCLETYITSSIKCPLTFLSDNAVEFRSDKFAEFCEKKDITHIFSSPYNAFTNGFSEKNCGLVIKQLRFICESVHDWDLMMPQVVATHNFTINSATNQTPSSYILENAHLISAENVLPSKISSLWHVGNPNFAPFKVSQEVLYKIKFVGNLTTHKLKPRYKGIYKVTQVISKGLIYKIKSIFDSTDVKENVHFNDLRPFTRPCKLLKHCQTFQKYYKQWYQQAFPADVTEIRDGMPGVSVSDSENRFEPTSQHLFRSPSSVSLHDSISSFDSEEEERRKEIELKQAELEYQSYLCDYSQLIETAKQQIPVIPKNLFQPNLKQIFQHFTVQYVNNPIFTLPLPNRQLPYLGPDDRGVPLAIRTTNCYKKGIIDKKFNFNNAVALHNSLTDQIAKKILKTAITYNLWQLACIYKSNVKVPNENLKRQEIPIMSPMAQLTGTPEYMVPKNNLPINWQDKIHFQSKNVSPIAPSPF